MAIDKRKLFESARERWPLRFRITPVEGWPSFDAKPELEDVYTSVEARCEPKGERTSTDEWIGLANWSFHQALSNLAKQVGTEGYIYRDDVTFEMFDEWMLTNLSGDECWTAERSEYEASPSRFH